MPQPPLLTAIARAFLAGEPGVEQIVARVEKTLGRPWPWVRPVALSFVEVHAGRARPRHRDVVRFIQADPEFARAWTRHFHSFAVEQWVTDPQRMLPVPAAEAWVLPAIETAAALAAWLQVTLAELAWFAGLKGPRYSREAGPKVQHYHYRVLAKGPGSVRLIEAPKPRLKEMQRRILTQVLEKIPPPSVVHGFVKARSIKTFAAPHTGQRVVLRMDLRDFFPSIGGARIQAIFRTLGYPEAVADLIGGICTNAVPAAVWNKQTHKEMRDLYARPHLPQGAPTSPALANLCAYRIDCRLAGLAKSAGAQYTRYADDLAISGGDEFNRCVERFSIHAAAVLMDEGFPVNHRKTRIMHQGVRQYLAGVVVNHSVNVIRADFDRLKAILTNCLRLGPQSQNRDAHADFPSHLGGRVAFIEWINPEKGKRLRTIFDRISW